MNTPIPVLKLGCLVLALGQSVALAAAPRVTGELKQWHKVTLTIDGPAARERDASPNPFLDYRFNVAFRHESGVPEYVVPGYFAADGNAANTSADAGDKWRAHVAPDKPGRWTYEVRFAQGKNAAVDATAQASPLKPFDGIKGEFRVGPTDKQAPDFRARGLLQYVGKHHLRFAGSKEYFLKAGADAPETLLAYSDFDGTETRKVPLKTWQPHVKDWKPGDPVWAGQKGKGLIGALNYLSSMGMNAFSFLTYNAGGDGDNVWPFVARDDKLHYDCSKLDQWQIVFDHAQSKGLYLHFKMQENEMDDDREGHDMTAKRIPESLDGGKLGIERKLYIRELVARFGYELALNWNLGEENTQSTEEQIAMAQYIKDTDPYDHNIVVHTFPDQQDKVYAPLLGKNSPLTGASLQNGWKETHQRTLKWVTESAKASKPWVVANDEQGPAALGVPPDPGFAGFNGKDKDGKPIHTIDDIRKYTLWANLMAGGAGVEYYFGYQLPENDLVAENYRSRDKSWTYARLALGFFRENRIPFWQMSNADGLVSGVESYCLAQPGDVYAVYLHQGGNAILDLSGARGQYKVEWFDPRNGGPLKAGSVTSVAGRGSRQLGEPPDTAGGDWVVVVRR